MIAPKQMTDLIWSMDLIQDKERGREFLETMAEYIPTYSPLVRKLYTQYDVTFSRDTAVILPKPYSHTQNFSFIPNDAIKTIGIRILPSLSGMAMVIGVKNGKPPHRLAFADGLAMVRRKMGPLPFLPIIQKGDLREYRLSDPALYVRAVDIRELDAFSKFDVQGIVRTLNKNLDRLAEVAHDLKI